MKVPKSVVSPEHSRNEHGEETESKRQGGRQIKKRGAINSFFFSYIECSAVPIFIQADHAMKHGWSNTTLSNNNHQTNSYL